MGEPLEAKGMPGWGCNGGKSGKLGAHSSPGAERLARVLRGHPAVFFVGVGQGGWISASSKDCWGWSWGWARQLLRGQELALSGTWAAVCWGALKELLGWVW